MYQVKKIQLMWHYGQIKWKNRLFTKFFKLFTMLLNMYIIMMVTFGDLIASYGWRASIYVVRFKKKKKNACKHTNAFPLLYTTEELASLPPSVIIHVKTALLLLKFLKTIFRYVDLTLLEYFAVELPVTSCTTKRKENS